MSLLGSVKRTLLGKNRNAVNAPRFKYTKRNHNHTHNDDDNNDDNDEQPIYFGAMGFVFRTKDDPTHVFKIYLGNVDIKKEYNKANTVFSITKDARQKVQIVKDLKFWDLPRSIQDRIPLYFRNRNLTAIRMNDLGVDLHTCTEKHLHQLASIPDIVPILLAQFYKLLHQVDQLHENGIYHCDIRLENIMIDLKTGILTLIDFDLLGTLSETIAKRKVIASESFDKGEEFSSTWPIEWLVIGNKIHKLSNNELIKLYASDTMLKLYEIAYTPQIVKDDMIKYGVNPQNIKAEMDLQEYLDFILTTISPVIQSKGFSLQELMSGFDTFGLGFAFSYFLHELQRNKTFQRNINDHDKTLIGWAFDVARSMCRFNIRQRTPIREAVLGMRHFLQTNGIPLPISGGRQRRRQTRRR